jgi:hypothetical protein
MARSKKTDQQYRVPKQSTYNNLHASLASYSVRANQSQPQEGEVEGMVFNERAEWERKGDRGKKGSKKGEHTFPGDVTARDEGDGFMAVIGMENEPDAPITETPEAPAVIPETPSVPPVAVVTPEAAKQVEMAVDEAEILVGEAVMQAEYQTEAQKTEATKLEQVDAQNLEVLTVTQMRRLYRGRLPGMKNMRRADLIVAIEQLRMEGRFDG